MINYEDYLATHPNLSKKEINSAVDRLQEERKKACSLISFLELRAISSAFYPENYPSYKDIAKELSEVTNTRDLIDQVLMYLYGLKKEMSKE